MKRRKFNTLLASASSSMIFTSFKYHNQKNLKKHKISLAQWSLNKMIKVDKTLDPIDFAKKSSELGFDAVEYVSTLYRPTLEKISIKKLTQKLKSKFKKHEVLNLLIMVDDEGNLSSTSMQETKNAIEKHKKWIEMASLLECHSVRVNLEGEKDLEKWKENSARGLSLLCDFARNYDINIIVENHGGNSSNGSELASVIRSVGMDNCGTLPDFGSYNFCIKRGDLNLEDIEGDCDNQYDKYVGVEKLLPYAKGISAKSHEFNSQGEEKSTDYSRMIDIITSSSYKGFITIEYEGAVMNMFGSKGNYLNPHEGVEATKKLISKYI